MMMRRNVVVLVLASLAAASGLSAQGKRKVIIDQDACGPATTGQQAILVLIQSPDTEVLGITVPSGDQWRDEEVAHTLRMLEIIGRTDIPVVPGAVNPLLNNPEEIQRWEKLYGKVDYMGAWSKRRAVPGVAGPPRVLGPFEVPALPEGAPTTKPAPEDAAHFLMRKVHEFPHQVSIVSAGPLTDLALAIALDPEFPALTKELVIMGGSISPPWDSGLDETPSRREFNFWWDPEASRIVLRARWPKITVTTVDISVKTRLTKSMLAEIGKSETPLARYLTKWAEEGFMWDELAAAAWLDPTLITKQQRLYMSVSVDHGANYGDTLIWQAGHQPGLGERLVNVQVDLNKEMFYRMFVDLMTRPTPGAPLPH
jgi:purine nucleosidase